jgi:hypothetical protein
LSLDACFTWGGIEAEEVRGEGELLEDGEVMGGMAGTSAHPIVGEDVHAPVEMVLDVPMLVDDGFQAMIQHPARPGVIRD